MLQAALNGKRNRLYHTSVPITTEELVNDALACFEVGADNLHFHVRNDAGEESLHPDDVKTQLKALRKALPRKTQIGISTAEWIVSDRQTRLNMIANWSKLPDFVSINLHEEDALDVAEAIFDRRIEIEAGLSGIKATQKFLESPLAHKCLRILIEPDDQQYINALNTVKAILRMLDNHNIKTPKLIHGYDQTAWPILEFAVDNGYDIRVGFEDTCLLPNGQAAQNNAELISISSTIKSQISL